jgi:hypothetical protein
MVESANRTEHSTDGGSAEPGRIPALAAPLADRGSEGTDIRARHLGERAHAATAQVVGIALQIAVVGEDRVAGEASFDREMVEVVPDRAVEGVGLLVGQVSTSSSGAQGRSCASATWS